MVKLDPFHVTRLYAPASGFICLPGRDARETRLRPPRSRCDCVTCRLSGGGRARTAVGANAGARRSEGLGPGASRSGGGAPRSPRAPQQTKGSPLCCQPPGRSARANTVADQIVCTTRAAAGSVFVLVVHPYLLPVSAFCVYAAVCRAVSEAGEVGESVTLSSPPRAMVSDRRTATPSTQRPLVSATWGTLISLDRQVLDPFRQHITPPLNASRVKTTLSSVRSPVCAPITVASCGSMCSLKLRALAKVVNDGACVAEARYGGRIDRRVHVVVDVNVVCDVVDGARPRSRCRLARRLRETVVAAAAATTARALPLRKARRSAEAAPP